MGGSTELGVLLVYFLGSATRTTRKMLADVISSDQGQRYGRLILVTRLMALAFENWRSLQIAGRLALVACTLL